MNNRIAIPFWACSLLIAIASCQTGCTLFPQRLDRPQIHNPFPQLRKVAVVPFFNQSDFPQINGAKVAASYRHQLQQVRGFEVVPVGVVDQYLSQNPIPIDQIPDFQKLARDLGVDAVVVGSITDFDPYYPPKMGLAVRWYAANTGFHPIPPGYGLPWGTAEEEYIPDELRFEAEFALATEQLKTQTPVVTNPVPADTETQTVEPASATSEIGPSTSKVGAAPPVASAAAPKLGDNLAGYSLPPEGTTLPVDWPDPNGFVPDPPAPTRPVAQIQRGPVMELIKQYDGSDSDFTARLESYYAFRDDARFGGWQSYLQRTDDFISFCCYLHISELLTARGGAGYARPVWRWPLAADHP
ncbi:MAG: hypothetical protein JNL67_12265 [Planctomycetaceae bacterium]|nr:hypothetical protein [Planctomycetaceae bacterium]